MARAQSGQGAESNPKATSFRGRDAAIKCVQDTVVFGCVLGGKEGPARLLVLVTRVGCRVAGEAWRVVVCRVELGNSSSRWELTVCFCC
jgi:hypothetical protein